MDGSVFVILQTSHENRRQRETLWVLVLLHNGGAETISTVMKIRKKSSLSLNIEAYKCDYFYQDCLDSCCGPSLVKRGVNHAAMLKVLGISLLLLTPSSQCVCHMFET